MLHPPSGRWLGGCVQQEAYRSVIDESLAFGTKKKGLEAFAYVIITNHVHLVVRSKTGVLSDTVRDFKVHISIMADIAESKKESRRDGWRWSLDIMPSIVAV